MLRNKVISLQPAAVSTTKHAGVDKEQRVLAPIDLSAYASLAGIRPGWLLLAADASADLFAGKM